MTRFRPKGRLWHDADFLELWAGQTVSLVGTAVTMLALPTAAILVLHAGAFQVGVLAAVQRVPFPVLGLFAGVWVDRVRRRPLMVIADMGRAVAIASVPIAAFSGTLTMAHLYAVAAVLGTLSVLFDVGYLAYLPGLVGPEDLVEGNTKLQISYSLSSLVGPSIAGVLIQAMGAARSLVVDAVSYIVSVVSLLAIRRPESRGDEEVVSARAGMRGELGEGLRLVFGNPVLRSLLLTLTVGATGFYMALPIFLVLVYNDLRIAPAAAGAVFALEGVGQLIGALVAARCVRMLRLGPTIALGQGLAGLAILAFPLALVLPALPTIAVLGFVLGLSAVVHDVNQVTLRQSLTPARLQGRMNATFRTFFWGVWPVASFLGGLLASTWGHAQTLMLGGAIAVVGSIGVVVTPLWKVREHPGSHTTRAPEHVAVAPLHDTVVNAP